MWRKEEEKIESGMRERDKGREKGEGESNNTMAAIYFFDICYPTTTTTITTTTTTTHPIITEIIFQHSNGGGDGGTGVGLDKMKGRPSIFTILLTLPFSVVLSLQNLFLWLIDQHINSLISNFI